MLFEKPWDQFQQRTEWTSAIEDIRNVFSFSKEMIVTSLDEEYSTRAEAPKPSQEEYPTRAEQPRLSQREQIYKTWQQDCYPVLLAGFKEKLHKIAEREDNWDEKGSKKPSDLILSKAQNTLEGFLYSIVNSGKLWIVPFVSTEEDGSITIQWSCGNHELHIEIYEEKTEYIKIWGVNIEHEMHLGILNEKEFFNLWNWLAE